MKTIDWQLMKELTQTPGAPGRERAIRQVMERRLAPYSDELVRDRLGSIFGRKVGQGPRVMLAGHMDEVAFMVTQVHASGFLSFQPLGGWWSQVLLAQPVEVWTSQGKAIRGIIGSTPPHLLSVEQRKKPMAVEKMFIDIGATSQEEVYAWGVQEGDAIVPYFPYTELEGGRRILSKAWDNRFGCGIAIETLREVQDSSLSCDLYAGATVQEEVGVRGALTASHVIQPDVFFAVDTGPAGDTPGVDKGYGKLGEGILIRVYDRSLVTLPTMRDFLLDVAETENIPYQYYVSRMGGTDAGRVHITGEGVPSAAIGVSARYIHSHGSVVDTEDVEMAKAYAVALVKHMNESTYRSLLEK